jgi:hypothetical protein
MSTSCRALDLTGRSGHPGQVADAVNAPVVIEVSRRADGKLYPPGGTLPEPLRWRAANRAHRLVHRDGLSVRQAQRALAAEGLRRSVGTIARDLARYECEWCAGPLRARFQRQPGPAAGHQQPGPAAAAGPGWAGPAPSW